MFSFMSEQESSNYLEIYAYHSSQAAFNQDVARDLLMKTGLQSDKLAVIWNLSIRNNPVSKPEFVLAMFLVSQFRNGIIINSLPSNVEQEFEMLLRKAIPMQDTGSMHIQNTGQSNGSLHIQNTGQSNASNPARVTVQPILPPLNSVQQQQQQLNWIITPQEKAKYDQILISAVDNQGYISASQAKQIFAQSGLRENMLRHIWDLADMNRRGKLNSDEFAVAMYLIYAKLGGRDLPRELPQELVPPSQRELSKLSDLAKLSALQEGPMRRISPAGSLVGLNTIPSRASSAPKVNEIVDDTARREELLALVEGKGGEITSLQSQTEIINRSALTLEMRFEELRKDSITARQEILKSSGRIQPAGLSDIDKARFIILDREMPILIQKAKENVTSRAKSRLEKLKPSAETVSSKAAALLAERMAAMGVKTSVPSVSAPIQERVEDVEGDQRREMEKIVEIENRFQTLSAQIKSSFTTGVSSTSLVINEKFESGIGIRSRRGRELFEELMAISLPMTVDLNDMAPALDKVLVPKLDVESPFGSVRPVETNPFAFESAKLVQSSFGQSEVGNGVIQSNTVHPAVFSSNLGQNFPSVIGQFDNAIHDHPPNNQAQSGIKSPVTNSGFPHPTRKPAPPKPSKSAGLKPHPKIAPEPVPSSTPIFVSNLGPALVSSSSASTPFDGSRGRNESSRDPKTFSQSLESTSPLSKPVSDTAAPANIPFFTPVGGVMPPPPPPPPPTLSDGTVTPVRLPSTAERESSTSEVRPKPKPSDVGAQGPNLFALMNAVKDKVESITNTTPNVDIVKSDPHNFPPKLEISGTNPFHSTTSMLSAVPVSANPFGTPAFAHNPFDREKTTTVDSTKSNESGWEIVPKDDLYEVVVEFDYTSSGDNDLSVVTGSVLKVEQEDDEWLLCRTDNGSSGWIPKSFAKRKDVGDDASVYAIDPADESPSVPYEAGVEMSAEVLFDFEGRNEDEVTVNTGQIVFILSKEDEDWWKINANGLIGFVPQNFLREIHAEDGSVLSLQLKDDVGDSLNPFGSSAMIFTPSASEFPITAGEQFVDDLSTREGFSRKEAVQEMLVTERSYVDDLLTVQKQFILPLTQFKNIDTLKLFSNFLQIIEVNSVILTDFEECMATGSPIGTAFLKHLDNLQCYKIYCENLDLATSYLQKSRTLDPELNEFLKKQQNSPACKHLDLSSYLLIPMQRITRYSLLLRQILHYTAKDHPHYDASLISLQMSEEFLEEVNLAIKLKQSISNINRIIKTVDLDIPSEDYSLDLRSATRSVGSRLFLHEGIVQKNKSGRKLLIFLFNDILLLTQSKPGAKPYGLYRKPLILEQVTIREAVKTAGKDTGPLDTTCFQIIYAGEVITLRASNVSEKRQWINQVETAKTNLQKAIGSSSAAVKHSTADTIGTLNVQVFGPQNCFEPGKYRAIFVVGKIKGQILKSKIVDASLANPRINQSLIFTISSLDDKLQLTLYHYDKYSSDKYLGEGSIQLDFLEYYAGKETEHIKLPLKDGGYESISIKMMYKPT